MSDTSPKNHDALLAGHVRPATQPRSADEEAWRVSKDGRVISCQSRDESKLGFGFDVVILQDDQLSFLRRCLTEEHARFGVGA